MGSKNSKAAKVTADPKTTLDTSVPPETPAIATGAADKLPPSQPSVEKADAVSGVIRPKEDSECTPTPGTGAETASDAAEGEEEAGAAQDAESNDKPQDGRIEREGRADGAGGDAAGAAAAEDAKRRKAEEEEAKRRAEEQAEAEEKMKKERAQEEAAAAAAAAAAAKRKAEEEEKEEERKKKMMKAEEEAAARKRAEEEKKRKAEAEAKKKKMAEEEEAKKKKMAKEEEAKRAKEKAAKEGEEEAERKRKAAEEGSKKTSETVQREFTLSDDEGLNDDQPLSKADERARAAAKWVDQEIRKLIGVIVEKGKRVEGSEGHYEIAFGELFKETEDIMEALSGTLITAKKHKVVVYEGHLLMQRFNDDTIVKLLKTEIDDSSIENYTRKEIKLCTGPRVKKGGKKAPKADATQMFQSNKCGKCSKTAYPQEQVVANGTPYHKTCFRCTTCQAVLKLAEFASLGTDFYCKPHYTQAFLRGADYNENNFKSQQEADAKASQ